MTKKLSLRDKIEGERRRRANRSRPQPVNLEPATEAERDRFVRHHVDVLQNIEFGFVQAYRTDANLDDRSVYSAIRCALLGSEPLDEKTGLALFHLYQIREMRSDIVDDVWNDGLRVVLGSIWTHSSLHPGETGYLDFVDEFIV